MTHCPICYSPLACQLFTLSLFTSHQLISLPLISLSASLSFLSTFSCFYPLSSTLPPHSHNVYAPSTIPLTTLPPPTHLNNLHPTLLSQP